MNSIANVVTWVLNAMERIQIQQRPGAAPSLNPAFSNLMEAP